MQQHKSSGKGVYSGVGWAYTWDGVGLYLGWGGLIRGLILRGGLVRWCGVGSYSGVGLYLGWAHTQGWAYTLGGVGSYSGVGLYSRVGLYAGVGGGLILRGGLIFAVGGLARWYGHTPSREVHSQGWAHTQAG